jgi:hypothetical protein
VAEPVVVTDRRVQLPLSLELPIQAVVLVVVLTLVELVALV